MDSVRGDYLPDGRRPQLRDYGTEYRALTHAQTEFLAGRVSVINQCVPAPLAGEPRRRRPAGAKEGLAWVPTVNHQPCGAAP